MSNRLRPDPDKIPALVPVREVFADRKRGQPGYIPYSEGALRKRIRSGSIKVVRLGPRLQCLDRATIKRIQTKGLPD